MDSKRTKTVQTLIDASIAYCRQISVVANCAGRQGVFCSETYRLGTYIGQQDLALLADLLEVSTFMLMEVALAIDVKSSGLELRLGGDRDISGFHVASEHRPYLAFIFAAPKIVPEIIENMRQMLHQARDLTDRLNELATQVNGTASLARL